jgi:hypothetical protein
MSVRVGFRNGWTFVLVDGLDFLRFHLLASRVSIKTGLLQMLQKDAMITSLPIHRQQNWWPRLLSTQTPLAIGNMNTKADQNLHQNSFDTRGIRNHCNLFGCLNVIVFHSQQNFP